MPVNSRFIVFDLEGPLSPNDSVLELTELLIGGGRLLDVVSRYDELLSVEGRKGHEMESITALVAPFLIVHGISLKHLLDQADKAELTVGAKELVDALRSRGWQLHCITATYLPYARRLAQRLDLEPQNVWGTVFPLDYYRKMMSRKTRELVKRVEREVASLEPREDDAQIREKLDELFSAATGGLSWLLQELRPMVGQRKVLTLRTLAMANRLSLKDVVAVGDSVADLPMLDAVGREGGLAVAFNASQRALASATIGLASTNLVDLLPVLEAWAEGGRPPVAELLRSKEAKFGATERDNLHWVGGGTLPAKVHARIRRAVRPRGTEVG